MNLGSPIIPLLKKCPIPGKKGGELQRGRTLWYFIATYSAEDGFQADGRQSGQPTKEHDHA